MADSNNGNPAVPEEAAGSGTASTGGEWVVAGGSVKDASGKAVRGLARVIEHGYGKEEAASRARELGGRALRADLEIYAPLVVRRLAGPGTEPCEAAEVGAEVSRKSVLSEAVRYDEALAAGESGWVEDGSSREVVCALPPRKGAIAAIAAAAACVAIAIACAVAFQAPPASEATDVPSGSQQAASDGEAVKEVSFTVRAEGVQADSGSDDPRTVAVQPRFALADADGEVVDEGEIAVGETSVFELEYGTYSFELTGAPVLEDGTTFELPDEPVGFEVGAGTDGASFEIELEAIPADDMTKEQLEAVAAELEGAGLADAAAQARDHASSAPSVSGSAGSVVRDPDPGSSSGGSSAGGSSSGGSSSSGSSSGGSPSQPEHQHSWTAQTEQRWVPDNVWVVDQAAWDEPIYSEQVVCACGAIFDTTTEWSEHVKSFGWGNSGHSYSVMDVQTGSIHHEEVGHWEDRGHYETVTTGYVCSGCGAVK